MSEHLPDEDIEMVEETAMEQGQEKIIIGKRAGKQEKQVT